MIKTRILLVIASALVVILIFMLPKSVVENENQLAAAGSSHTDGPNNKMPANHQPASPGLTSAIAAARKAFNTSSDRKNAIFADSLQTLYAQAGKFDSAAWFGEKAATFFNRTPNFLKAGNSYYEAYTFAMDEQKRNELAEKTRHWLNKVIDAEPKNYEAKVKVAMTYLSTGGPMQGIRLLREVLKEDPKNELALFNMGMLSVQSGQHAKAISWLNQLIEVNPKHTQGQLLLGVAYMNAGQNGKAREQFEKVKKMDKDPAVQSAVDSYLSELK
ncbi:MAG: tetratricopeptide repeat protein [Bacteroidetes bacterium]|nr:tetratricopeptide repeat protein [Bacteroidota bacterium]MBS1540594.1 tetratricopeptide repeat protein [Bacteroidota bacterium]